MMILQTVTARDAQIRAKRPAPVAAPGLQPVLWHLHRGERIDYITLGSNCPYAPIDSPVGSCLSAALLSHQEVSSHGQNSETPTEH